MTDLVVVGAGPAGLAAAAEAARHGLAVTVLDEGDRPGGRLLGQLHPDRAAPGGWFRGAEAADRLAGEAAAAGATVCCGWAVWAVTPDLCVHAARDRGGVETLKARAVVLATGAAERPLALPGWTLPGVMTAGAAQILVNRHRVRPGRRGWFVGVNPLSLAVAHGLALAGIEVAGCILPPPDSPVAEASRPRDALTALAHAGRLADRAGLRAAARLARTPPGRLLAPYLAPRRLSAWGVPVRPRTAMLEIRGAGRVEAVVLAELDAAGRPVGRPREEAADFVCVSGGLGPLAELAAAAGCTMAHVPELGGEVPLHGPHLETTVPCLFVAGNVTGVEGAAVAEAYGRLAGAAVAGRLGALAGPAAERLMAAARREVERRRREAPLQFHPGAAAARRRLEALWRRAVPGGGAGAVPGRGAGGVPGRGTGSGPVPG